MSIRLTLAVVTVSLLPGMAAAEADVTKLNTKVDVPIRDAAGQTVRLPEAKATVLVSISSDWLVSNVHASPLADLAKVYAAKNVMVIGLCASDTSPAEIEKQSKEFRLGFPVYKDVGLAAAQALKAATTPEAFILDRHG